MGVGIVFVGQVQIDNISLPLIREKKSNNVAELNAILIAVEKLFNNG